MLRGVKLFCFMLLIVITGCEGQDDPKVMKDGDEPKLSSEEIKLEVGGWKPMTESRATLYESLEDIRKHEGDGGVFTLYGYLDDKGDTFLGGAKAFWYEFENTKEWRFVTGENDQQITYYWPNSDKVNFFAHMPHKGYDGTKKHYVKNIQYSEANGPTFDCELPNSNTDDVNQIEFIYAYEEAKGKEDKTLTLHFKHPFAALYFQMSPESSRMTVNSLTLKGVYLNGTFSVKNQSWVPKVQGTTDIYTATVDKRIPNDVNYDTPFIGPILVMPQELGNQVELGLKAIKDIDDESTVISGTKSLTGNWLPGKKYIYTLGVGDRNEEIYFNVAVEDWEVIEYKNEINVE